MEKNKTGKYLKYAIGEIILVVIGILIALQINNWNENRKERQSEVKYYKSLKLDMETDLVNLDSIIKQRRDIMYSAITLSGLKEPKTLIELKTFDSLKNKVFGWRSYAPRTNTLDELISSGGLNKIKNDSIKLYLLSIKERNGKILIYREHMRHEYENYLYDRSAQIINGSPFIDFGKSLQQKKLIFYTLSDNEIEKLSTQASFFLQDLTIQNGLKLAIKNNLGLVSEFNRLKSDVEKLIKFIDEDVRK
jgi:hypothetical protein